MPTFADLIAPDPRLRRSVIDPETGNAVVSPGNEPDPTEIVQRSWVLPVGRTRSGAIVPAAQAPVATLGQLAGGFLSALPDAPAEAAHAVKFFGDVAAGRKGVFDPATGHVSDEAMGTANAAAGLAMTGSMPFKAPRGALRSFGGAAEHADDPFAALEAGIVAHLQDAAPARPQTFVDPKATTWDLYHGTSAAKDFDRFEVDRPREAGVTAAAPSEAGALYLSPAADEAAHYAGDIATKSPAPRIFRTSVAPGETDLFDIPHLIQNDPSFVDRMRRTYLADEGDTALTRRLFDNHIENTRASLAEHAANREVARGMGFTDFPSPDVHYAYGAAGAAVQAAKERGLDTAILRGLGESNGGDQVVALTPGRVRSYYDPTHVLYSGGPGGPVPATVAAGANAPQSTEAKAIMPDDPWATFRTAKADPAPAEADPWATFRPKAADASAKPAPVEQATANPKGLAAEPEPAFNDAAAVGRGIINGVPVVGPYLLAGVNRGAAAVRTLQNGTTFPEELKKVEAFGEDTEKAHPWASTAGELTGGVVGTAPLVAAAPVAFGAGAGPLLTRAGMAAASGGLIGAADSAVRSGGDSNEARRGAEIGAVLGAAGPIAGKVIGAGVRAVTGPGRTNALVGEALEGISDKDIAAAQQLIEQARSLPGAPITLTLDEALNAVTGGQAGRASQLARVVANSGGEGGRIMNEVYAGRPAAIDNVGRASLERVAPQSADPTGLGFDIQDAARKGVAQTPEGMALTAARDAAGPRVSADQAGQVIQPEMRRVRDGLEAKRSTEADRDYAAAREAPETVALDRTVSVERPGEPVVTEARYSRPQFTDAAPRPLDPPPTVEAQASAGPESLARFVAKHGGIRLDGEAAATDLHRFNIPGLGNVARADGNGIDNFWRERLIEEGYFRPDADGGMARDISSDLLRKLQNEQRGVPSYPIGQERAGAAGRTKPGQVQDEYRAALSEAETRLDGDLTKAGVDPAGLHPDVRSRVLGAMMRGETSDPLDAYERVVAGMREAPAPFVKGTTVTDQVEAPRWGQVDPRPALDAVAEQGRHAKGDVRGALSATGRDLLEGRTDSVSGVREPDMTVAGNLKARERLDHRIADAEKVGDGTKVRDLTILRKALDGALKDVPEVAAADARFAANSRPLEPFEGDTPLDRVTRQDSRTKRMATPTEQVPSHLSGATAAREFLANATPEAQQAYEGHVVTRIMEAASDKRGTIDPDKLHVAIREQADTLAQMPAAYHRLDAVVVAQDGLSRVMATPLGRIAKQDPSVGKAVLALFPQNPGPGTHGEISQAVEALARNRPLAARQLVRHYLEATFNEATQDLRGLPRQYGGAGFASAVRGNAQQRHNLEAALRALPDGDTALAGMNRMLDVLDATGYRPQKGSDTAFNAEIQQRLKDGAGSVGRAITEVVSSAAAGAGVGGPKGALGGGALGAKRAGADLLQKRRMEKDGAAIARVLTDPKAMAMLDRLAKQPEGSRGAELLTTKLLQIGSRGAVSAAESSPAGR